ncbi:MAG TPA: IS4 family transposase [Bryobacteraceae bacterium]|nr:IS4 family transposase [Bryobacteraceae bacterium]
MASITGALSRIKQDLEPFLPEQSIRLACQHLGHRYRRRQFDPAATLHLFILQILCFNTALTHLRHLTKMPVTAAAFCKARMRLPLALLQLLLRNSAASMAHSASARWRGLRTWLVDGSSTITPDCPALDQAFGHPSGQQKGCGFPVPKILGLFDAVTGLIVEVLTFPLFTHEMSQVARLHPLLGAGDLLVGDRGFCSYGHLALLRLRGVAACFRMHQRQIVSFRPGRKRRGRRQRGKPASTFLKRLGRQDQLVRWHKPLRRFKPRWMTVEDYEQLPDTLDVREVRYQLEGKGQRTRLVTIATTLLDPVVYPKESIAELYRVRWQVETHFAELKTTLKMRKLKCLTVQGVYKELAVYALVYNLVHVVMMEAARRQQVDPDRISFLDTVRWLLSARPGEEMPSLLVNPSRPDRHEPRVIKDLQDSYRKMTKSRAYLRKHPRWAER